MENPRASGVPPSPIAALVELSRAVADADDQGDAVGGPRPGVVAGLLADAAERWLGASMAAVFITGDSGGMALTEARGPVPTAPCDDPLDPECWADATDGLAVRVLPLASGGSLFGALVVGWTTAAAADEAGELASGLVDIAAVALDRTFRTRSLVRSLQDLAAKQQELTRTEGLRRMGQMAAVVAHEVRNPLASIGGVLQVLHGRCPPGSQEQEVMGKVLERLADLNRLVGELLQYARPAPPTRRPVELAEFLAETASQARADPALRDVTVALSVQAVTWPIDPAMVQRLLLNLVLNAGQAMEGRGRIELGCRALPGSDGVELWVSDEGPGVPEDQRARLFEPFVTTKVRGTGLGLAVAQQVAEAHGGTITYQPSQSGGACFVARLADADRPRPVLRHP
jgi:signal transduction histidine kinase